MATNRSLNKLEFKAHMSIHNIKEVSEGETHEARNRTRDRFGKSHALSNEDGTSRVQIRKSRLKVLALAGLFGSLFAGTVQAEEADLLAAPDHATVSGKRSTDIQVGTEGLDANSWLNQKFNQPEDKFGIPLSDSTTVGFNEDGDPNVGTRF